jgi:hypothetical protein
MIKLKKLLSEIILKEFNKSQTDFISTKLNISNNDILNSLLNKLNSQDITYSSIKLKILSGDIKNLKDLEKLKGLSKEDELRRIKNDGVEKVFEKGDIFIYILYTWEASCIYGRGTKWCTSAKDDEGSFETQVIFDKDTLYYIIDKSRKDAFKKVAIVVDKKGKISDIFDDKNEFDYNMQTFSKDTTTEKQAYQNYLEYLKSKGVDINIFKSKAPELAKLYKDYK